jgi:adenylate kinase family enzyme
VAYRHTVEIPAEQPMRRVAVMGIAGSGKSTFAVRLGEAMDAPVFHLDAIYWKTGKPADWEDFRAEQRELLMLDRFVLDGNYSKSGGLDERLARIDAVVFMDAGRWTALRRILWRHLRGRGGPSAHGNPGGVSWQFLRWVWNWNRNHPDFAASLRRQLGDRPVFVVRSGRDAEKLLAHARAPKPPGRTA